MSGNCSITNIKDKKMPFLHPKSLEIHNQRRAKRYLKNVLQPKIFQKIREVINKGDLPLKWQESTDIELFNYVMHEVLKEESKVYLKIDKNERL